MEAVRITPLEKWYFVKLALFALMHIIFWGDFCGFWDSICWLRNHCLGKNGVGDTDAYAITARVFVLIEINKVVNEPKNNVNRHIASCLCFYYSNVTFVRLN